MSARRPALVAGVAIAALGTVLAVAYFPQLFNRVEPYDDEGYVLLSIRNFLEHRNLYEDTFSQYGPFYYLVTAPIFWLSGKQPTLDNGRLIVLVATSVTSGLFAVAVWRITKSLSWTVLCQVGTFLLLVSVHGAEPMHPGALIALLLSVLVCSLCSWVVSPRAGTLFVVGATVGALLMTKVNVGLLAFGALLFALVVGNDRVKPRMQSLLLMAAVVAPFVLVFKKIDETWAVSFALMVSIALLELGAISLADDPFSLSRRSVVPAGAGLLAMVVVSAAFPLVTGSSVGALFDGVVSGPLQHPNINVIVSSLAFDWDIVVLTIALALFVMAIRRRGQSTKSQQSTTPWPHLVLGLVALWLFGVGVGGFDVYGAWLLPVALVPALAGIADARPELRLAFRLLVPLVVLQALHAYPTGGSQLAWGTVTLAVPCAIAIAIGSQRLTLWSEATRTVRAAVVAALCLVLMVGMNLWPIGIWKRYRDSPPLALAGASLLRPDPTRVSLAGAQPSEIRDLISFVRRHCDGFWSVPTGIGSFYVFSEIDPPNGLFVNNWSRLLDREEQRRVVQALASAEAVGDRICIIRTTAATFPFDDGSDGPRTPLGEFVDGFSEPIAEFPTQIVFGRPEASTEPSR